MSTKKMLDQQTEASPSPSPVGEEAAPKISEVEPKKRSRFLAGILLGLLFGISLLSGELFGDSEFPLFSLLLALLAIGIGVLMFTKGQEKFQGIAVASFGALFLLILGASMNTALWWSATDQFLAEPFTPEIIEAASDGETETVKSLLAAGADVNSRDSAEDTALTLETCFAPWETVRVLLDAGADVNAKPDDGITALMCAARQGHTQTVKFLLASGANVEATDNDGVPPLIAAATRNETEIVQVLLDAGADVNVKTSDGATALMMAVQASDPGPTLSSRTDSVGALLDAGADVNAKNNDDDTVLMFAKEQGHTEIAELLRKAGAK